MSDTGTTPEAELERLAEIRSSLSECQERREALLEERRKLYRHLRASGVEHQRIAAAAGVTVPAVIQQIGRDG